MKRAKPSSPAGKKELRHKPPEPSSAPAEADRSAVIQLFSVVMEILEKANHEFATTCLAELATSSWNSPWKTALLDFAKFRVDATAPRESRFTAALRMIEEEKRDRDPETAKREDEEKLQFGRYRVRWLFALRRKIGYARFGENPGGTPFPFLKPGNYSDPVRRDLVVSALAQSDDWTAMLDDIRGYAEHRDLEFFTKLGRAVGHNQGRAPLFKPEEEFILYCWDNGIGGDLNFVGIPEPVTTNPGIETLYSTPPLKFWVDQAAADLMAFLFPDAFGDDALRAYRYRIKTLELSYKRGRERKVRTFEAHPNRKTGAYRLCVGE